MATTALRYGVLSLLCHVGFAQLVGQQASQLVHNCFRVKPDELDLDFSAATLRSNNLGGQGPGPGKCNAALPAGDAGQDERCGFYDLNTTHPYYQKMVFGNVVSAATSARLGGIVDLVISNTSPYHPHQNAYNGLSSKNGAPAFGSFNVAGSNSNSGGGVTTITLEYELHLRPLDGGEGPKTPILIPYIKFSLFDFDHGGDGNGQECVEASGYYDYAHSDPTVATTQTTLLASNQAYNPATGLNSGETYSPASRACQLLDT
mmetsp:Transcript_80988/g.196495  ORF Transcript_80988/g.196495 Transcript_80988/m.196495 type:complete len:261 (-) Transcript_80988:303-1085(-)